MLLLLLLCGCREGAQPEAPAQGSTRRLHPGERDHGDNHRHPLRYRQGRPAVIAVGMCCRFCCEVLLQSGVPLEQLQRPLAVGQQLVAVTADLWYTSLGTHPGIQGLLTLIRGELFSKRLVSSTQGHVRQQKQV